MFDLDTLKGATLDDKNFSELKAHIEALVEQRDVARQESITGRKGKDAKLTEAVAKLAEAQSRVEALAERLGVDPDADLDALPSAKGQAEAVKQFETRMKKLQRDLDEKSRAHDELNSKHASYVREAHITKAMEGHRFRNPTDMRDLIERRVKAEGEDLLFDAGDGKLVPLKEGVAWLAKTRPEYLDAQDAGGQGSGYRSGTNNGSKKSIPAAQFEAMRPIERAKAINDGYTVVDAAA